MAMRNTWVDVLIVGGGPAGTTTGTRLQQLGYKTCIIDKAVFPREKVCGGSMTQKTLDLLGELFPGIETTHFYTRKISRINFYLLEKHITTVDVAVPFYMTERLHLDNLLMNAYKESGGKLLEGVPFKQGMFAHKTVTSGHTTIGFNVLVGADGIFSQVRKIIQPGFRPDTFCLATDVPLQLMHRNPDEADIIFGYLRCGYAWSFPKADQASIGIGDKIHSKSGYEDNFIRLLNEHFHIREYPRPTGGFLFTNRMVKKPYFKNDILLVGDAAGLTEPITGEGIYYALRSGQLAAQAIHAFLAGKERKLGIAYGRSLGAIHRIMKQARHFHHIFYIPVLTRLFLRHISKRNAVARFYLDNTLSTQSLSYFKVIPSYFLQKFLKAKL